MSTTVIPPTSQSYWVPSYGSPSAFSFIFRKGSDKYVALGRVAQTRPDLYPDGPAMAKSTDGGATWTLYEEPVLLTNVGDLGPAYDCAFDGSGGTLTCFFDEIRAYDVPSGTYTYTCYVAEFDFATDSWGAKRAPLMLTSSPSPLSSGYFSSRPDGKFVLVLTTAAGVEYWILNGSTWSGPTSVASGTVFDLCVASDGVMHINVNGTYHHIDSSGSVLAVDGSGIFPVGPSRIKSNALTVPARSSGIVISRGTPPNAAIWTNQTVTALATIGYPAVYVTESPALGVDIAFEYDDTARRRTNRSALLRGVMRPLALILLTLVTATSQDPACELEAVSKWNKFANTSKRYLDGRNAGIMDAPTRARMRREFAAVMDCQCF